MHTATLHLSPRDSVGQWAAASPAAARTLADLQLDICCGGKRTLVDACREKNLDPDEIAAKVTAAHAARTGSNEMDPAQMSLGALAQHITDTHHAYLRQALPRIEIWIEKMIRAHGETNPGFTDLLHTFRAFRNELESHMMKEEQVLFPMAAAMERGMPPPMNLANPIHCMEAEHESAGAALERLRQLTDGYNPPKHACTTWRAAYAALAELEADMHRHVHKENNILFPRVIAMQRLGR